MLHLDYNWDLSPDGIILDEELNLERLQWKEGDIFKVVKNENRFILKKVDPVEKFFRGYGNEAV
jgi:hypothetical protein